MTNWHIIQNIHQIDSPALLVYPNRVSQNIESAIQTAGGIDRLRPHVKTHKMGEVIRMHVEEYGITKFKCATIAEAEMIALNGGQDVILAHQPTDTKIPRLLKLMQVFPKIKWRTLVDNEATARQLSKVCHAANLELNVLLDINNGYHRSGIKAGKTAIDLYRLVTELPHLEIGGLHVYDGHIHHGNFEERKDWAEQDFVQVGEFLDGLKKVGLHVPLVVAGGSPTFPVHAENQAVELSPGTYVFWDAGYGEAFPDMDFEPAALVMTRIISVLDENRVCVDLGHKSIASENPIHNRVRFLNFKVDKFLVHSEEHLVLQSPDAKTAKVGDILYGVPFHICPTVALHEEAAIVEEGEVTQFWEVVARKRKISI
ncbi:MAG: D-TA family PLP-dependent enzyme [Chitinophagales bacterium]